jgi:hypothetical protein
MRRHCIQTVLVSVLTMCQSCRLLCASRRKGDSRLYHRRPHGLYAASLCVRGHPSRRRLHQRFQRPFRLRNLPYSAQWPHSVPVKMVQVRPRFIHPHQPQSPILPYPPCSSNPFDLIPNKFWQTNSASMANYPTAFLFLLPRSETRLDIHSLCAFPSRFSGANPVSVTTSTSTASVFFDICFILDYVHSLFSNYNSRFIWICLSLFL